MCMMDENPEKSAATEAMQLRAIREIRDLSDFCLKWPSLKEKVAPAALDGSGLPEASRQTIRWLALLADRVCHDID